MQNDKSKLKKELKKQETTNHTNSTNKVKRFITFYVKENYIVNSFVKFVLFVVKKRVVGKNNKKLCGICG